MVVDRFAGPRRQCVAMSDRVTYEANEVVATLTMDDGKANVMSPAMLEALHAAFDRAERDRLGVVLTGRDKTFSAGFDLRVFAGGTAEQIHHMMTLGAELALRVLSFPAPVVTACTGHAFPMGAFLMLGADVRLGIDGAFQIGMNEVAIGLSVPAFAIELARQRLTAAHLHRIAGGEMLGPTEAVAAGYLDRLVAPAELGATAREIARSLASRDRTAFAATKARIRQPAIAAVRAAIAAEITLDAYRQRVAQRDGAV